MSSMTCVCLSQCEYGRNRVERNSGDIVVIGKYIDPNTCLNFGNNFSGRTFLSAHLRVIQ